MEHYRLGSSRVILSRSFCNNDLISDLSEVENVFRNNMRLLREYEDENNWDDDVDYEEYDEYYDD